MVMRLINSFFWMYMSPNAIWPFMEKLHIPKVSIHGLAPGSFQNFRKTENILDGGYYHVPGSRYSATNALCVLTSNLQGN